MAWFQVDDQLAMHRKVCEAGNPAMGLWVRAGAWSMANLTEGFVSTAAAKTLGSPAQAKALVAAGLWVEVPGGYQFHEWGARQMSAEQIAERRRLRAEAGRKGGQSKRGTKPKAKPEAKIEADAQASAYQSLEQNGTPVPVPTQKNSGYLTESATEPNAHGVSATPGADLVRAVIPNTFPDAVRTELRLQANALLRQNHDPADVKAALERWLTKTGVGARLLPSFLADVIKDQTGATTAPANVHAMAAANGLTPGEAKVAGWAALGQPQPHPSTDRRAIES